MYRAVCCALLNMHFLYYFTLKISIVCIFSTEIGLFLPFGLGQQIWVMMDPSHGNPMVRHTKWAPNQPFNTPGQSCLLIILDSHQSLQGQWVAQDCDSTDLGGSIDTVCELTFTCP